MQKNARFGLPLFPSPDYVSRTSSGSIPPQARRVGMVTLKISQDPWPQGLIAHRWYIKLMLFHIMWSLRLWIKLGSVCPWDLETLSPFSPKYFKPQLKYSEDWSVWDCHSSQIKRTARPQLPSISDDKWRVKWKSLLLEIVCKVGLVPRVKTSERGWLEASKGESLRKFLG